MGPAVRAKFQAILDALSAESTGSSNRIARARLLDVPPSIDAGEITEDTRVRASVPAIEMALKAGATKAQFDATMALHPSMAEELVLMKTPAA